MPIVRFEPGAQAPRAGTYAVTGEWGEPAGESANVLAGERLPLIDTSDSPRWYVLVAVADEARATRRELLEPTGAVTAHRGRDPAAAATPPALR
jgi:hypothetical protein